MSKYRRKAEALLKQMTLTEKVGQLAHDFWGFNAYTRDEQGEIVLTEAFKSYVLKYGGMGALYGFFRADPWSKRCYNTGGILASEREKAYNILQKFVVENTRLKIPVLAVEDTPHGWQALDSVIYPVSLNVGCSFNPELYAKQTEQIGKETKLSGVRVPFLSVFDIAVDPRWGRCEECFSEDPYLAACMSESAVVGVHNGGNLDNIYYLLGDYTPEQKNAKTLKEVFTQAGATYLQGWTFEDRITVTDEELAAGESKRVRFEIGFDALKEWSVLRRYEVYPYKVKLMLGNASDEIIFSETIEVK